MVDKENLGDNNMFQSRWDDFTDEGAFLHSHAGFLNSVLFKAKKHSKRKHAYPANVIPAQREREREKKATQSYPRVAGFLLTPRCCQNNALPLSKISS